MTAAINGVRLGESEGHFRDEEGGRRTERESGLKGMEEPGFLFIYWV